MNIEFTKEQYENLVKMITIATTVLDVVNEEIYEDEAPIFDDEIQAMRELEQYILSKHKDFDFHKVFVDAGNIYTVTYEIEEEVLLLIELYEEYSFWEELTYRLARRDVIEEYGENEVNNMDPLQLSELEESYLSKYREEFSQYGIDRLRI